MQWLIMILLVLAGCSDNPTGPDGDGDSAGLNIHDYINLDEIDIWYKIVCEHSPMEAGYWGSDTHHRHYFYDGTQVLEIVGEMPVIAMTHDYDPNNTTHKTPYRYDIRGNRLVEIYPLYKEQTGSVLWTTFDFDIPVGSSKVVYDVRQDYPDTTGSYRQEVHTHHMITDSATAQTECGLISGCLKIEVETVFFDNYNTLTYEVEYNSAWGRWERHSVETWTYRDTYWLAKGIGVVRHEHRREPEGYIETATMMEPPDEPF